jgi:hypothetical protein
MGYFQFNAVQFLYKAGIADPALGDVTLVNPTTPALAGAAKTARSATIRLSRTMLTISLSS